MTGFWTMDIMLSDTLSIEQDIESILTDHGYQNEQVNDTYIDIGVNWGYTGAQLVNSFDPMTLVAMVVLLLIIIFTGYLVIYNIFQISVSNDVRFYGLLKTIGITGRQLKRVIRIQGLTLSVLAIPLGLLAGYGVGGLLTPVILANLNGVARDAVSTSPVIFVVAALFSLFTVMFSCRKPGRMAARVSPIEAVRYAEYGGGKKRKKVEKSSRNPEKNRTANRRLDTDQQRNSLFLMALANVGRNRKKTFITLISLSLSVVLLNVTVTFVNGFDMDKYIRNMTVDLMLADAAYFQASSYWYDELAVEEDVIKALEAQDGFLAGGRTYGLTGAVQEMVTEEWIRIKMEEWMASDDLDRAIAESEKAGELIMDDAGLYGMEEFVLGKLELLDGDLSKLHEEGSRYIAAVYWSDDYGNAEPDSHWAKVGDMVTLRHVREWEMINPETGEIYGDELPEGAPFQMRAKEYQDIDYEVAATVTVPPTLSYRHFGFDEFILGDATFISDTGTSDIVYYAADTTDELGAGVEAYLRDFTEQQQTQYDYESKATYAESFESFKTMFTILGGVLSFIIGLVGILNFLNAMLTAIITRRREFAVLQAIGMTGRQLKIMLIWEGLYHTIGSVLIALILIVATAPLLGPAFGVFWFFSYRFTILPILIILPAFTLLGVLLPLISYHFAAKHSVVERLKI
ncbi:MAG: ABC transporter permease, partial [Lachnospiraceae bacterium]|jgi:putative ABC transport system permease protein|nr:ABC transporter permease [Lachnospiraceae bacterium]